MVAIQARIIKVGPAYAVLIEQVLAGPKILIGLASRVHPVLVAGIHRALLCHVA